MLQMEHGQTYQSPWWEDENGVHRCQVYHVRAERGTADQLSLSAGRRVSARFGRGQVYELNCAVWPFRGRYASAAAEPIAALLLSDQPRDRQIAKLKQHGQLHATVEEAKNDVLERALGMVAVWIGDQR